MEQNINQIINQNKLQKINDNIYLTNKQINILNKNKINYQKCQNLKEILFLINDIEDEEIEQIAQELSELNYYQYTNK